MFINRIKCRLQVDAINMRVSDRRSGECGINPLWRPSLTLSRPPPFPLCYPLPTHWSQVLVLLCQQAVYGALRAKWKVCSYSRMKEIVFLLFSHPTLRTLWLLGVAAPLINFNFLNLQFEVGGEVNYLPQESPSPLCLSVCCRCDEKSWHTMLESGFFFLHVSFCNMVCGFRCHCRLQHNTALDRCSTMCPVLTPL